MSNFNIEIHPFLPVPEVLLACDINTKEEIKIYTGKWIHAFRISNKIFVSEELFNSLKPKN